MLGTDPGSRVTLPSQRLLKRAFLAVIIAATAANGLLVYRVSCEVPGKGAITDWHWGLTQLVPAICDTMSLPEYLVRYERPLTAVIVIAGAAAVATLFARHRSASL